VCVAGDESAASDVAQAPGSVLALDFGNEWLKGCLVNQRPSPVGQHLDVVIDPQSMRKSANLMGFDADGERVLGPDALGLLFRAPQRVFPHVKRLLGKSIEHEAALAYVAHFPALELQPTDFRPSLQFKLSGSSSDALSVEEVTVMLLQLARKQANAHIQFSLQKEDHHDVSDVVLTVPEHWTPAQRKLFVQLAELAGFDDEPTAVLGELTAAAIDYAVRNLASGASERVVFYGAGTMGVSASLIELSRSAAGAGDEIRVKVLRSASDDSVGGYSYDVLVRDELAKRFDAAHQKKGSPSVTSNARAMAKLLREAGAVKEMLSASPSISHAVEELFNGKDFRFDLSAEELANWAQQKGVQAKMLAPLLAVLEGEAADSVKAIELFGGGVRVPSLQAAVRAAFPAIELGKHVDGDEAAMLGAAHYAAVLGNIGAPGKFVKVVVDESAVLQQASEDGKDAENALLLSSEHESALRERVGALNKRALERAKADGARNALESAFNDARMLLEKARKDASKAELVAKLTEALAAAEAFVDYADRTTTGEEFKEQYHKLAEHIRPLYPVKVQATPTPAATKDAASSSPPKPKRDRRAEHARAQAAYMKAKSDETKKQQEKAKPLEPPKTASAKKPAAATSKKTKGAEKTADQAKKTGAKTSSKDEL
jgi:molecular chaperone DnaK (HSP70)